MRLPAVWMRPVGRAGTARPTAGTATATNRVTRSASRESSGVNSRCRTGVLRMPTCSCTRHRSPRPLILSRRAFAWADADAVGNGYSGPSNAISPGSRVAKLNNNSSPTGGPAECRWSVNNCGPNDEPFAFHSGGLNVTMGDGSVHFLTDSMDGVIVKWLVGAEDNETINANL